MGSYGEKEWLTQGKEMLVYKDAEEAAGLIAKYLKDGKRGKRWWKEGREGFLKNINLRTEQET